MERITIVIADDHELVRKSIAALLRNETDFEVVGECSNGRELLDLVTAFRPSVAIVDVAMPELNGVEAARRIYKISPLTRVVALSSYVDAAYLAGMLEAGAVAYIAKSGIANDLLKAVREGTRGNVYLSEGIPPLPRPGMDEKAEPGKELTPRECEVLQLIAEGCSSREIAATLKISPTTVKTHRDNIMAKLGIHDTAGLTRHAIRIGLIRVE